MTDAPPQAAFDAVQMHPEWDGQNPLPDDMVFLSASSLRSVLASPALEIWGRSEISRKVIAEWEMLDSLRRTSIEQARKWIESAQWHSYRDQLSATDRGEAIHSCLEAWMDGLPTPNVSQEVWPHLEHLAKAVTTLNIRKVEAERVVYSGHWPLDTHDGKTEWAEKPPHLGWAGRFDLKGTVSGLAGTGLLDLKTSGTDASPSGRKKRPYADSLVMQLGAYDRCTVMATHRPRTIRGPGGDRLYLLSADEAAIAVPATPTDYAAVLYSTPERCDLYPVEIRDGIEVKLKAAVELYHYTHTFTKGALGKRIYTTEGT